MQNIKNNFHLLVLTVIIITSLFLRFHKQAEYLDFFADVGRDMLVAKHIAEDKKFTLAKPYANATTPYLNNSILYFNLLGIAWIIAPSIEAIMSLHTLLSILVVLYGYRITKQLCKDTMTGLFTAVHFTFSFYFIQLARLIWQPNLLPYIYILNLFLILKKKVTYIDLYVAIFLLYLGFNIHYSTAIMVPIMFYWILKRFVLLVRDRRDSNTRYLYFFLYITTLFVSWIKFASVNFADIYTLLFTNSDGSLFQNFLVRLYKLVIYFSQTLFGYHSISSILYFIFLVILLLELFYEKNKKKLNIEIKILYSLNFSVFFTIFLTKSLYVHYFAPLMIVTYITLATIISHKVKSTSLKVCLYSILLILFLHSTASDKKFLGILSYFGNWERNEYPIAQQISKEIATDYKLVSKDNQNLRFGLRIHKFGDPQAWGLGGYYLLVEDLLGLRLSKISEKYASEDYNYGNNIEILEKNPNLIYLVCDRFPNNSNLVEECIQPTLKYIPEFSAQTAEITTIQVVPFYSFDSHSTTLLRIITQKNNFTSLNSEL